MNMLTANIAEDLSVARARLSRLQGFLAQDEGNTSLLADVGDLALACGELEIARNAVQHALRAHPADPFFALRLSSIAIAEGNYDEAVEITERLLQQGHRDPSVGYNHAYALFCGKRFAEAKDLLLSLHAADALDKKFLPLLIRSHHYLGEIEKAVTLARTALETNPESADIAGMLALLYVDVNDLRSANAWANHALLSAPCNLDALLAASTAALGAENPDEARELALRAVSVQPQNGRAWANLGLAEMMELRLDAARANLAKAVKYMPEHIGTWHMLGWVQLLQKDVDGAEVTFNQALAIDQNFGESHGALATIAAMRGDWARADEYVKIARRLNPESMFARYVEILRLQRDGRHDLVNSMFDTALRQGKAPAGGDLLEMFGRIVSRRKP